MELGTFVKLADGREATVVYHGLDGYGVKWGKIEISLEDRLQILSGVGDLLHRELPTDYQWFPEAMLRTPYPSADLP